MLLAARVGDMTAHSTPLGPGPGSANVRIGGMPAWRAFIDTHSCPVSSPNPHATGKVTRASASVRINGFPAVRQSDVIIEAGPPNAIVAGCPGVRIGG